MASTHPELARPFAPHRLRIYVVMLSFVGAVFVFMTVAAGTGLVAPSRTVDVVANLTSAPQSSFCRSSCSGKRGVSNAPGSDWPPNWS